MNLKYFVKCISFQNQFWSIILYSSALIISLTMIFIDQPVYLLHQLRDVVNLTDARAKKFQSTINDVSISDRVHFYLISLSIKYLIH